MCGRFASWNDKNQILEHFGLSTGPEVAAGYNITPSSNIPVIRFLDGKELFNCHWGLIPHWARDRKLSPINARAESLSSKPFFRDSFKKRRCLIPANGFYEWQATQGRKQPYYIKVKDRELFAFAGLWDHWDNPEQSLDSCAIITTGANEAMRPVHDRMPVILDPKYYDAWLEQGGMELLVPYGSELDIHPVSLRVNSPKNQGPELIAPV